MEKGVRMYEGMFIMTPALNEEAVEKTVKGIIDVIEKNGGKVEENQKWGKRRLAFRIKKFQDGIYHLVRFGCPPSVISGLRNVFRLNENILRIMIISANSGKREQGGVENG